jgi:ribosomal protein S18 acetylase RimI-like enzyme
MPERQPTRVKAKVTLEPANLRDLGSLRTIEKLCFEKDAWPLIDLIGVLSLPGIVRIKAVLDGQMVGFIAGDPRPEDHIGWITTVGVHPGYRGQGIGTQLIQVCEEGMAMPKVRLSVRRSNLDALKLYAGLGYYEVGVWEKYYFDGEDALILEKTL